MHKKLFLHLSVRKILNILDKERNTEREQKRERERERRGRKRTEKKLEIKESENDLLKKNYANGN